MSIAGMRCLLINFLCFTVWASTTPDITGRYRCVGEDFLNKTTFDEPTEVTRSGDTYFFKWVNKNLEFDGTGILNDGMVSAIFWAKDIEAIPGVVAYRVLPNGDLKGKWTIKRSQKQGNEYCHKIKGQLERFP